MTETKILALIPARGGSKGIPKKNIAPLAGKPLIAHTIEVARTCPLIDRVVVSTDDDEIAGVAIAQGAEVPFRRPADASNDTAFAVQVIEHALTLLSKNESYVPDAVLYLQPTSPFRRSEHLRDAIEQYTLDKQSDGLVSVTPVPHNFHPHKIMTIKDGYAVPVSASDMILNRHDVPRLHGRNGPSILITRTDIILERGSLYGTKTLPYIIDEPVCNIDIDIPDDLELAEFYASRFFDNT